MIREVISDVLAYHQYGWYRPGEVGGPPYYSDWTDEATVKAKSLEWRCGCGWTTGDHHRGVSPWIDHCDHVAEQVVKAVRSYRTVDAIVERFTPYSRRGEE